MHKWVKSYMFKQEQLLTAKLYVMSKNIPDLHEQAFMFKNTKRFQHDGGRAWIKDSQLHEARKNGNGKLTTIDHQKDSDRVEEATDEEKASI